MNKACKKIFLKFELKLLHKGIKRKLICRKGSWEPCISSIFTKQFLWAWHLPGYINDRKRDLVGNNLTSWLYYVSLFIQRS